MIYYALVAGADCYAANEVLTLGMSTDIETMKALLQTYIRGDEPLDSFWQFITLKKYITNDRGRVTYAEMIDDTYYQIPVADYE